MAAADRDDELGRKIDRSLRSMKRIERVLLVFVVAFIALEGLLLAIVWSAP